MGDKSVVVYGASGYTGRLICEYLREYNLPFVAAGRDGGKLKASMEGNVAGIETADYEVVEVTHDVASLTELFSGASVVLNTVGPFSKWGPEVVEACLAAGADRRDLLLATAAPRHGEPLGDEVVAGVPVFDLDHVTGAAEPGDLVRENQLRHISPYLPAPA